MRFDSNYFLEKITSLEIAEEIIVKSNMPGETKRHFGSFLSAAKTGDKEAEAILKERLAGWLASQVKRDY